jgi:hypothetical protein
VQQLWGDRAAVDPWGFFLWPQQCNIKPDTSCQMCDTKVGQTRTQSPYWKETGGGGGVSKAWQQRDNGLLKHDAIYSTLVDRY